jgi:hypothetical protein
MVRNRTVPKSPVDIAIENLKVGDKIPIVGSPSYWRNRQSIFHRKNPKSWVKIFIEKKKYYAERLI